MSDKHIESATRRQLIASIENHVKAKRRLGQKITYMLQEIRRLADIDPHAPFGWDDAMELLTLSNPVAEWIDDD